MARFEVPETTYINIEWVGDSRELPEYGLCAKGRILGVPSDSAIDLIDRGFAKLYIELVEEEE